LEDWAREQYNLGNAWCELPNADFPESWQEAIKHYKNALQVRTRQSDPEHYASTLQNLGTAYRELPTGDRATNVKKAIGCYHRAIQVNRPSGSPLHNAALHNNLGNAYLSLPAETASRLRRNVHRALRHFGRALLIRTKEHYPCDYALTQFNRGNGLLRLVTVEHGDQSGLEQAVTCFREAREFFRQCGQLQYAELAENRLSKALDYLSRSRPVAA
jgi:tetratricopeptide (TPR) repeat protein